MEDNGDKSQEATDHRREQAREQGQVARSQDLASASLLLVGAATMLWLGPAIVDFFGRYTRRQLGGEAWVSADNGFLTGHLTGVTWELGKVLLPLLGVLLLTAIGTNLAQVGLLFVPDRLMPDISRLDPLKGLQRIVGMENIVRLLFGVFKVLIVAGVAWWSLAGQWNRILGLAALDLPQILAYFGEVMIWTAIRIAGALVVLALLDFMFQRWKHEQDLRMTTQEVREEMKNLQGDPQVIARRKAVQRQLVLNRLGKTVPQADVVVTNPTELAVAIRYDPETMAAPVVAAKGAGVIAQRIRRLALEHGIPIVEKKPLAQALYKDVDVNRPVPMDLYAAVAEVLAYVYQLKGKSLEKRAA